MLNGVSVALRTLANPPCAISRSRRRSERDHAQPSLPRSIGNIAYLSRNRTLCPQRFSRAIFLGCDTGAKISASGLRTMGPSGETPCTLQFVSSRPSRARPTPSPTRSRARLHHQRRFGFMGYYVVYAPDDTVTAISIFNTVAEAEDSNRRALALIDNNLGPGYRARDRNRRAGDRAFAALRFSATGWGSRRSFLRTNAVWSDHGIVIGFPEVGSH